MAKTKKPSKKSAAPAAGGAAVADPEEGLVGDETPEEQEKEISPAEEPKRRSIESLREKPAPASEAQRIAESREALKHPLPAGMKFFESPEGYIVVGEANREHVFCRHAAHGKGMNINPRR